MQIDPAALTQQQLYKILVGSVVPRPIAWVSTLNAAGQRNLAPFSFFNVVCPQPPTLSIATQIRGTDGLEKDTAYNIRATGEFVVNIVTEATLSAMNITSTEFAPEVDEFAAARLTPAPSIMVKPPRVLESPIQFECKLNQIVMIQNGPNNAPGGGSLILGTIVYIHVSDEVLLDNYKIDARALHPVGRLAGAEYCHVTDLFALERPGPLAPSTVTPPATCP